MQKEQPGNAGDRTNEEKHRNPISWATAHRDPVLESPATMGTGSVNGRGIAGI